MKTKIFLGMGLLLSAMGFSQTNTLVIPANNADGRGNTNIGTSSTASSVGNLNLTAGPGSGAALTSTANNNVFLGVLSGNTNATGELNVFIGSQAGMTNTGSRNVFVGGGAGRNTHTTENNCFFGHYAGSSATGSANICIGRFAGNLVGDGNVCVGHRAGAVSTGSNNIFIGNSAASTITGGDNQLFIDNSSTTDPLIHGNFSSNQLEFNGAVGIGRSNFSGFPDMTSGGVPNVSAYSLFVDGGILTEEVRIRVRGDWPDYVFANDYKLLSLKDTEEYIAKNGHLPNMPSAANVKAEGIEMGNIVTLQQEKIEELTLHLIEQQKQIEELKAQMQLLLNKQ